MSRSGRRRPQGKRGDQGRRGPRIPVWALGLAAIALVVVGVAAVNTLRGESASKTDYDVGQPGVGTVAPDFTLPNANGGAFQLSAHRGQDVLLYFHEGLGCAPCWQQLMDLQKDVSSFRSLGIDQIVSVSVDSQSAQAQHAEQVRVTLPVLADENKSVSATYDALSYGMMGGQLPGHTFILVDGQGVIRWRADYGGPPNFTMYVSDQTLLAELRRALNA